MPERAAFWPARRALLVADLHLGKCETFRVNGAPIPAGVIDADLQRLAAAIERSAAQRVVVVGDLLHAAAGLTPAMVDHVAAWRAGPGVAGVEIVVVPGNHDRRLDRVAAAWDLRVEAGLWRDAGVAFVHDPDHAAHLLAHHAGSGAGPEYIWSGHLHPVARLAGGGDRLRLPCFWLGPRVGVLPAFTRFAAGAGIIPAPGDRVYAIAGAEVVPIPV